MLATLLIGTGKATTAFEHAGTPDSGALATRGAARPGSGAGRHIIVVGAGAFGGWTALWLLRAGARVTLVDAWGPGNARSSSGDDTRVIRAIYGPSATYTRWTARSLRLWREHGERWGRPIYEKCGCLWMFATDLDSYARDALPHLRDNGLPVDVLSGEDVAARWPVFATDGLRSAYFEHEAGFLRARAGCQMVAELFVAEGGRYVEAAAKPGRMTRGRMGPVALGTGERIESDAVVWACGPWLGHLFPKAIGPRVASTRQEIYYFGTPAGDVRFSEENCPCWVRVNNERAVYGIPGNDRRGMKIGDDTRGPRFNPTTGSRVPGAASVRWARRAIGEHFPALTGAPLVEARVCQYENSPDGHVFAQQHPDASNCWFLGGGSGHGYKLGPALGEVMAGVVLEG